MIKSISIDHEYCDRCINGFDVVETETNQHCLVCEAVICRRHTALTLTAHRARSGSAYLFICERCMETPITGVKLLAMALRGIHKEQEQEADSMGSWQAEDDATQAMQDMWDAYATRHNQHDQVKGPPPSDSPSPGCIGGC